MGFLEGRELMPKLLHNKIKKISNILIAFSPVDEKLRNRCR
jgi:hypothetical protein